MLASRPSRAVGGPAQQSVKWRAQDVREIAGQDDRVVLRFATGECRVVVTHDLSTMIPAIECTVEG